MIIFRENVSPEFDILYDNDGIKEISGKNNILYIVVPGNYRNYYPVNGSDYEKVLSRAGEISTDISDLLSGYNDYFKNIKSILEYYGIKYSPVIAKRFKAWAEKYDGRIEDIVEFLSLTTGEKWDSYSCSGYSQGDYAIGIYCKGHYSPEDLELYVGAAAGTADKFAYLYRVMYYIKVDRITDGMMQLDVYKISPSSMDYQLKRISMFGGV